MMEEEQEQRFVCKFCSKRFVSGKSLGGHMRGHLALISAQKDQDFNNGQKGFESFKEIISKKGSKVSDASDAAAANTSVEEKVDDGQMGILEGSYGLRENPKKSWRVSDSKIVALNGDQNICKECGKAFHSLRALSGHMRSHSMKGKKEMEMEKELLNHCKKCGKGFESMRAMYGHMRSHSKRSKQASESEEEEESKTEFGGTGDEIANPVRKKRSRTRYKVPSNPSCSSNLNSSFSSFLESDEVEEVAMCLIMLSRGVRNWDEFNADFEKGNNALIEKGKSGFGDFDFEYSKNGGCEVEFEASVDESFEGYKVKNQSELGLGKNVLSEVDLAEAGLGLMRPRPTKKLRSIGQDFGSMGISCDQEVFDATEAEIAVLKRSKEHECSICFKGFGSGQALGGHKRAHYNGITESRATDSELLQQEFAEIHKLFDLNLSVNLEDGLKSDNAGFKPWWIGGDLEREQLAISLAESTIQSMVSTGLTV